MALTVTATASGAGSTNGIALFTQVLNNASYTQNGATASSVTATLPQLAITPNTAGNWVYGVAGTGATATLYSSILGNTTSVGQVNLTNPSVGGMYRSTSSTTTSSTTYGWGAPTESSGSYYIGSAEIVANAAGFLAVDASTPAIVSTTASTSVTTASFTPPGAAVIVVGVAANWPGSGAVTITVTDSASAYTWTKLADTAEGTVNLSTIWVGIPNNPPKASGAAFLRPPGRQSPPAIGPLQPAPPYPPTPYTQGNPGTASATGTAQQPAANVIPAPAAASATATAQSPSISASGTASPSAASSTATAQGPVPNVIVIPAVAHATATALSPTASSGTIATPAAASATATALSPSLNISSTASPSAASSTATAQGPVPSVTAAPTAASATATAQAPGKTVTVTPGVAQATAAALSPAAGPAVTPAAASATAAALFPSGKTVTVAPAAATATAAATIVSYPTPLNHWAVTFFEHTLNATASARTLDSSLAARSVNATLAVRTLNTVITEGTMQQATLTLAEFNDMTIDFAVTSNGAPYNLTGMTLNLLFKSAAGVPDSQALTLSSGGGSPAITITSPTGGLATAQIPNGDLNSETYFFYRLDVVNGSSQQQTTVYGPIVWVTL